MWHWTYVETLELAKTAIAYNELVRQLELMWPMLTILVWHREMICLRCR